MDVGVYFHSGSEQQRAFASPLEKHEPLEYSYRVKSQYLSLHRPKMGRVNSRNCRYQKRIQADYLSLGGRPFSQQQGGFLQTPTARPLYIGKMLLNSVYISMSLFGIRDITSVFRCSVHKSHGYSQCKRYDSA